MRFGDSSTNSGTFGRIQALFRSTPLAPSVPADNVTKVTTGRRMNARLDGVTSVLSRNGRDRRRHARLRVHGEGALERVPQGRVHGVAASARATAGCDCRAES